VVVTSDLSSLGGLAPGEYDGMALGMAHGEVVAIEANGKIHMPQRQCLAGSGSTMLQCMNQLHSTRLLSEDELWRVASGNALRLLGAKAAAAVRRRSAELGASRDSHRASCPRRARLARLPSVAGPLVRLTQRGFEPVAPPGHVIASASVAVLM
jgi:hypothetical protein